MNGSNVLFDVLVHLGYVQLNDGLYEDAAGTFSAALILDETDDRALRGRGLANAQLNQSFSERPETR